MPIIDPGPRTSSRHRRRRRRIARCTLCKRHQRPLESTPHTPCSFEDTRRLVVHFTHPRTFPGLFAQRGAPPSEEPSHWRATLRRDAHTEVATESRKRSASSRVPKQRLSEAARCRQRRLTSSWLPVAAAIIRYGEPLRKYRRLRWLSQAVSPETR